MIAIFVAAVVLYIGFYSFIECRRTRNGPWSVTFALDGQGIPTVTVNEPKLQISNLKIHFPGHTASPTNVTVVFHPPKPVPYEVPFGDCVFLDTTFQPGTVVLEIFGHEVQLMPRVLTIDKTEIPWKSDTAISITSTNAR